jgi:hypothetical protein
MSANIFIRRVEQPNLSFSSEVHCRLEPSAFCGTVSLIFFEDEDENEDEEDSVLEKSVFHLCFICG